MAARVKNTLVITAVLVVLVTALASAKIIHDQAMASRAHAPLEGVAAADPRFTDYDIQKDAPRMRTFDLTTDLVLARADSAARVIFDFADVSNHYYAEFAPRGIRVVAVQDGIGRVLESVPQAFAPGETLHVTITRREPMIRVIVNDEVRLEVCDETFYSGQVGTSAPALAATFTPLKVQSVAEIYFADDFMRATGEKGEWTELRGSWRLFEVNDHASMSANAFQYIAQGADEAAAVAGLPFWDDYSFEAAVKPQRADVGLTFYYRDENNYFRFEWTAENTTLPGSGAKRLVRVWHGKRDVLAESQGGYRMSPAPQWYTLKVQAAGERVRAFIDDRLIFDVTDSHLVGGMVGLYAAANNKVAFDDVFVRSHRRFEDRFASGGRTGWEFMGGEWSRLAIGTTPARSDNSPAAAPAGALTVRTPDGEARAAVGAQGWSDYVLETEIHPDAKAASGRVGVILHYQDETRYYLAFVAPSGEGKATWTLERVLDDKKTTLDTKTVDLKPGAVRVSAGVSDSYISVRANGETVLEGFDTTLASGRGGLFAANSSLVTFAPVRIDWPQSEAPLLTLNEIFEHEDSMSTWSTYESDWLLAARNVWINKGDFPGDASIDARLLSLGKAGSLGLMLSADCAAEGSGYLLRMSSEDGKTLNLQLDRLGVKVETATAQMPGKSAHVSLKRIGSFLVGCVDRRPVLVHRDGSMLPGDLLGWYARDAKVESKSVAVASPNVRKDIFRRAYTDWRVIKGIWEISNRWECDPRWTFFSGRSWQLAGIWSKRPCEGEVTLDFYSGPKMDRERQGNRYEGFADINCTLGADGVDLSSGYSFLFGGFANTKTVLVKGDKIVAEAVWPAKAHLNWMREGQPAIIPSAAINIHHEWFHLKAQKSGNRLRYWIDDELVIDYVDKDAPLTGNRVALWTYNNGIMVGRATLAADRIGAPEPSDVPMPGRCRCIYDQQAAAKK